MDLRCHVNGQYIPSYDAMSDGHLKSYHKTKTFKKHWTSMGDKLKPETGLQRLIHSKLKPRTDAELPYVAQRPHDVLCLQLVNKRKKLPKRAHEPPRVARSTVYLGQTETFEKYDKMFFTKEKQRERKKSNAPVPRPPSPKADDDDDEIVANDLTLTYLSVIKRSEDYQRRQIAREEAKELSYFHTHIQNVLSVMRENENKHREFSRDESAKRRDVESMEAEVWAKLMVSEARDKRYSKLNEEVFPQCAMMSIGEHGTIPTSLHSSFMLEIRWVGEVELSYAILGYDRNNQFMGTTTLGEVLRCPISGLPVVRPWGAQTSGVRGNKCVVEFMLCNLHSAANYSRFVIAIFNGGKPGTDLQGLHRCYCTIKVPTDCDEDSPVERLSSQTKLLEQWAIKVPRKECICYVASSIIRQGDQDLSNVTSQMSSPAGMMNMSGSFSSTRRSTSVMVNKPAMWGLQCHLMQCDIPTHQRLPKYLAETLLMSLSEMWQRYESASFLTYRYNEYFWEEVSRKKIQAFEDESWLDLIEEFNEGPPGPLGSSKSFSKSKGSFRKLGSFSFNGIPKPPKSPRERSARTGIARHASTVESSSPLLGNFGGTPRFRRQRHQ